MTSKTPSQSKTIKQWQELEEMDIVALNTCKLASYKFCGAALLTSPDLCIYFAFFFRQHFEHTSFHTF